MDHTFAVAMVEHGRQADEDVQRPLDRERAIRRHVVGQGAIGVVFGDEEIRWTGAPVDALDLASPVEHPDESGMREVGGGLGL